MKSFNFIISLIVALLSAVSAGIKLWLVYGIWAVATYAAVFLALPVMIVLHELGHMLFGAVVKIKAVPTFSLISSSSCKIIPKTQKNLRTKIIFTAAGGLFINFVFIVLGAAGFLFEDISWLLVFLPSSVYLFWLNGISGQRTDGEVISKLLKHEPEGEVMLAVLKVQAEVLCGTPIEAVDKNLLFSVPQIREDDESFIALTELRYEYFKAIGDSEQAERYKSRLEDLKQYL